MPRINHDDVFRIIVSIILSLLAYIGQGIKIEQVDISSRLRLLEINQARIMDRMGIEAALDQLGSPRLSSHLEPK
jgi:hypothetical protein